MWCLGIFPIDRKEIYPLELYKLKFQACKVIFSRITREKIKTLISIHVRYSFQYKYDSVKMKDFQIQQGEVW